MIIYLKNIDTQKIWIAEAKEYLSLSPNIRENNIEATEAERDSFLLQEAKDSKIADINKNRKEFIYSDIEYNGSTFINSEISSNALSIVIAHTTEPIEWLDINNVQVDLTKLEAEALLGLMIAHRKSAYFQEASKISAVNACSTIEEVEAIDITFI